MRFDVPRTLNDDNSSFGTASDLGVLGASISTQPIRGEIQGGDSRIRMPGDEAEPGHRHIPPENHFLNPNLPGPFYTEIGSGSETGDEGTSGSESLSEGAPPTGVTSESGASSTVGSPSYVPGRLILRLKDGLNAQAQSSFLQAEGLSTIRSFSSTGAMLVQLAAGVDARQKALDLSTRSAVQYAEPDYYMKHISAVPNDPAFGELWGLQNTGQAGGTSGADIDVASVWNNFVGSSNTVIAIIDSGVDYTHPDLAANMWRNPGEIPGDGIDNDGNGYVDDIFGIDTANNDSDPFDDVGHGTHVAGTAAAVGNNGVGVAGVNWAANIMALKFLDASGFG
jgi:subtilisin family serine protease